MQILTYYWLPQFPYLAVVLFLGTWPDISISHMINTHFNWLGVNYCQIVCVSTTLEWEMRKYFQSKIDKTILWSFYLPLQLYYIKKLETMVPGGPRRSPGVGETPNPTPFPGPWHCHEKEFKDESKQRKQKAKGFYCKTEVHTREGLVGVLQRASRAWHSSVFYFYGFF